MPSILFFFFHIFGLSSLKLSFRWTLRRQHREARLHHHLRWPLWPLQSPWYTHYSFSCYFAVFFFVSYFLEQVLNLLTFVLIFFLGFGCVEHSHEQNVESELVKQLKGIIKVWNLIYLWRFADLVCLLGDIGDMYLVFAKMSEWVCRLKNLFKFVKERVLFGEWSSGFNCAISFCINGLVLCYQNEFFLCEWPKVVAKL